MSVSSSSEKSAYELYLLNWAGLAALTLFVSLSLPAAGLHLKFDRETWGGLLLSAGLVAAGHYLLARNRPRFAFVALSIAQYGLLSLLGVLLTYIAASANLPLQDALLDRWDRALGLDWTAYYRLMTAWPELVPYECLGYAAIAVPAFGVPLILGLTGNYVRLQRFVMATLFTLIVVAFVSAFIPAIGTYEVHHLPTEFAGFKASGYLIQLERLPVIRSWNLQGLSISQLGGIVTFPSFHAAAAVLALWAWWNVWWMRPWAVMMCSATLLTTPLFGGHYFVDVFAGAVVACLAVALTSAVGRRSFAPAPALTSSSVAGT